MGACGRFENWELTIENWQLEENGEMDELYELGWSIYGELLEKWIVVSG